jgi:hypothetical protein
MPTIPPQGNLSLPLQKQKCGFGLKNNIFTNVPHHRLYAGIVFGDPRDNLTLIIGNKNYSSWSLRPWLALKQANLAFQEIRIPLYTADASAQIYQYSPAGKVPILTHGATTVWESLAICDYLAETFPAAVWWPEDTRGRALARSNSAEIHAGFTALRENMPMNCRASLPGIGLTESHCSLRHPAPTKSDINKCGRSLFQGNQASLLHQNLPLSTQ